MKYRAFISYRRQDASAAARWLRNKLLGFRPPTELLDSVTAERRVDLERRVAYFLDTSYQSANEDFWAANIEPALRASEYLIVISSPSALQARADGSDNWVAREIDTFLKVWGEAEGRRRIVLALAPGAPDDRFPGRLGEVGKQWDWADLRVLSRFAWARPGAAERLGDALLKILARIHEVPQELLPILRQEEARKRGRTRLVAVGGAATAIAILSGALGWAVVERGNALAAGRLAVEQRDQALRTQSQFLAQAARAELKRGDSGSALALALEALPRGAPGDRPYVAEAEAALYDFATALLQERRLLGRHSHSGTTIFRPDLGAMLLAPPNGPVKLFEVDRDLTFAERWRGEHANWARFSDDGRRVLTAEPNLLVVRDRADGRELARILMGKEDKAALSPDNERVLVATGRDAAVWEVRSGQRVAVLGGHTNTIDEVSFSRDGRQMLTTSRDGMARLWDAENGRELAELVGHTDYIAKSIFLPDGARLLTASYDGTVRLWDRSSGESLLTLTSNQGWILDMALSSDGKRLLTGGSDDTARLWDLDTGRELAVLRGHDSMGEPQGGVRGVHFSSDGKMLLTMATLADGTARLWSSDGGALGILRGDARILAAQFTTDAAAVVTTHVDGTMRLWNVKGMREVVAFGGRDDRAMVVAFSSNGSRVVTGGKTLRVWDARTGAQLSERRLPDGEQALALSPDGGWALVGSERAVQASVWDVGAVRQIVALSVTGGPIGSAAFTADGSRVVTAAGNRTVQVWALPSGRELASFSVDGNATLGPVALSPDGAHVAVGSHDGTVRLWRVGDRKVIPVDVRHDGGVSGLAFSPDGKRLMSGGHDYRAHLVDVASGRELAVMRGHESFPGTWEQIRGVFSPDGTRLVTTGVDHTMRFWDVASGRQVGAAGWRDAYIVRFSPDGRFVLGLSYEGDVRVWHNYRTPQELIDYACTVMPRPLTREQRKQLFLDEDPKDPPCGWHPDMKEKPPYAPRAAR